jgi:hypothetical protein
LILIDVFIMHRAWNFLMIPWILHVNEALHIWDLKLSHVHIYLDYLRIDVFHHMVQNYLHHMSQVLLARLGNITLATLRSLSKVIFPIAFIFFLSLSGFLIPLKMRRVAHNRREGM